MERTSPAHTAFFDILTDLEVLHFELEGFLSALTAIYDAFSKDPLDPAEYYNGLRVVSTSLSAICHDLDHGIRAGYESLKLLD